MTTNKSMFRIHIPAVILFFFSVLHYTTVAKKNKIKNKNKIEKKRNNCMFSIITYKEKKLISKKKKKKKISKKNKKKNISKKKKSLKEICIDELSSD